MNTKKNNRGDSEEYLDPYYTVEEVAKILKITRATVYKWMNEGKLPYIQLEGVRRVSREDLQEFITVRRHIGVASQINSSSPLRLAA